MAKKDKKHPNIEAPETEDATVVFLRPADRKIPSKPEPEPAPDPEPAPGPEPDPEAEAEAEDRRLSRRDRRRTVISLVLAAVLFCACILLWLNRDRFDPDRFLVLAPEEAAEAKAEYVFDAGSGQVFATAGTGLAAATATGIQLMDADGHIAVSRLFQLETPAIAAGSDCAVFYDIGGTAMCAAFFDGTIRELRAPGTILSATMSAGGYLAVTTDYTGYRALVTVYDPRLEPVYAWYSSSAWVLSAAVSPDNRQLAALCYTASGSEVRLFRLDSEEQQAAFSVSDTVLLDVRWLSQNQLCAYSAEQAIFFTDGGTWSGAFSFDGRTLTDCAFGGEGFAAFALSRYRGGSASELVTLDTAGRVLGRTEVPSEIVSLTASGTEVLVLGPDGALLYSSSLSRKGGLSGLTGFKYALLRSRGEALLVSANYAEVYTF